MWEIFLLGLSGAATLYFGVRSVPKAQIRSAYPSGDLQACLQGGAKRYLRLGEYPGKMRFSATRYGAGDGHAQGGSGS